MAVSAETPKLEGDAALPRRNQVVFEAPWQGRVFGMAVALSEMGAFSWEEFRQALIAQIAIAAGRGGQVRYDEAWLAAFERLVTDKKLLASCEIEETTFSWSTANGTMFSENAAEAQYAFA